MTNFESLDREAQIQALSQLGQTALAAYGLDRAKLTFISDTENTVFKVVAKRKTYVLRIHSPDEKSVSQIEGELHWLAALRRDTTLRVPEPVLTTEGKLVQVVQIPEISKPRPVVLFHWLPGQILGEHVNPKIITELGQIMAQLHNHAAQFDLPSGVSRPPWGERDGTMVAMLQAASNFSDEDLALCLEAAKRSGTEIEQIDQSQNYGLIHCDIHPWNCLRHQGKIRVIDFDDCRLGSFVEDIGITLTYFDASPNYEALRAAFFQGYTQFRSLSTNYQPEIEAFMVSRGLGLICWVLGWSSVDHHPFGPDMLASGLQRARRYMAAPRIKA